MCVAGRYIERIKKETGISNRQLAIKAGVNPQHMSMMKKGSRPMPEELIIACAEILNIDAVQIEIELLAEKRHGNHARKLLAAAKKFVLIGCAVLATGGITGKGAISNAQADSFVNLDIYYTHNIILGELRPTQRPGAVRM